MNLIEPVGTGESAYESLSPAIRGALIGETKE
jgi:hypothetical protein